MYAWSELANHSNLEDFEDAGLGIRRPVRFSSVFCTNAAGSGDLLLKQHKNNLTFSETGCDWLGPTLEHNVIPVLTSQWLSDCLSGQNRNKK